MSQTSATATKKTCTARIWSIRGGPPLTSIAAITTRLPVMWAANNLRLTKLITSTVPATTLSTEVSRRCKNARSGMSLGGDSEGRIEFDSLGICKPLFWLTGILSPLRVVAPATVKNDSYPRQKDKDAESPHRHYYPGASKICFRGEQNGRSGSYREASWASSNPGKQAPHAADFQNHNHGG